MPQVWFRCSSLQNNLACSSFIHVLDQSIWCGNLKSVRISSNGFPNWLLLVAYSALLRHLLFVHVYLKIIETCILYRYCSEILSSRHKHFAGICIAKSVVRSVLFFIEFPFLYDFWLMEAMTSHRDGDRGRFQPVCCDRYAGEFVLILLPKISHRFQKIQGNHAWFPVWNLVVGFICAKRLKLSSYLAI